MLAEHLFARALVARHGEASERLERGENRLGARRDRRPGGVVEGASGPSRCSPSGLVRSRITLASATTSPSVEPSGSAAAATPPRTWDAPSRAKRAAASTPQAVSAVSRADAVRTVSPVSSARPIGSAKNIRSSSSATERRTTSSPLGAGVGSPGDVVSPAAAGRFQAISPLAARRDVDVFVHRRAPRGPGSPWVVRSSALAVEGREGGI